MHDFLLAKEIIDEVKRIIAKKGNAAVKSVSVEIGMISLAHDGHPEHAEDISEENLRFGLESIAKNTALENVDWKIRKIPGDHWRIADIETE